MAIRAPDGANNKNFQLKLFDFGFPRSLHVSQSVHS